MAQFNHLHLNKFRTGAIALVLATTAALTACNTTNESATQDPAVDPNATTEEPVQDPAQDSAQLPEESNVQLGELTGNIEDYLGQTVSVRGAVETTADENSFLLQDERLFGGEEVVVFNASGEPFVLPTEELTENVQVTGEVQEFVLADVEQEYGVTLDPQVYAEYENQPAILAESLVLSPEPEEVSEAPEAFYEQPIAVSGAVGEQLSANVFKLQDPGLFEGDEVLVIASSSVPNLEDAGDVVVTGTLRPYVAAEFERDYDLTLDSGVQEQIEAEYAEQPVLVADEIYSSAE